MNQCKETIWPAIITDGGNFQGEGFTLESSQTAFYNAQDGRVAEYGVGQVAILIKKAMVHVKQATVALP